MRQDEFSCSLGRSLLSDNKGLRSAKVNTGGLSDRPDEGLDEWELNIAGH